MICCPTYPFITVDHCVVDITVWQFFVEMTERVMDKDMSDRRGIVIRETVNSANDSVIQESNSSNLGGVPVLEMAIVMRLDEDEKNKACCSGENADFIHKDTVSKVLEGEVKLKNLNDEKLLEGLDEEWICRICQLSSDQVSVSTSTKRELIQLGCGCLNELGSVHSYCAEAWFNLKGDRLCEICGETAKNVTGIADNVFIEEWNERRSNGNDTQVSDRNSGCCGGQPIFNFLMACLVIAFVIPWFLRVNVF